MSRTGSTRALIATLMVVALAMTACDRGAASTAEPIAGSSTTASEAAEPAAEPSPTATAEAGEPLVTGESTVDGLTVEVRSFERTSPEVVTLEFALRYSGEEAWQAGQRFAEVPSDGAVASGLYLVNEAGQLKHLVLRDANGTCLCSELEFWFNPGTTHEAFAQFPAPPPSVDAMTIYVPTFMPLGDVPLEGPAS